MLHIERHIFGSFSGYTTLGKSPGLSADDARQLEQGAYSFGQSHEASFLGSLARTPAYFTRTLSGGRRALCRGLEGKLDDTRRPTICLITAVLSPQDWDGQLCGDVQALLDQGALWNWDNLPNTAALEIDIRPSAGRVARKSVPRLLALLSEVERNLISRRPVLLDAQEYSQADLVALEMLIPPAVRRQFTSAYRSLNPQLPVSVNCLAAEAPSQGRAMFHYDPGLNHLSPYAQYLSGTSFESGQIPLEEVSAYRSFGAPETLAAAPARAAAAAAVPPQLRTGTSLPLVAGLAAAVLLLAFGAFWLGRTLGANQTQTADDARQETQRLEQEAMQKSLLERQRTEFRDKARVALSADGATADEVYAAVNAREQQAQAHYEGLLEQIKSRAAQDQQAADTHVAASVAAASADNEKLRDALADQRAHREQLYAAVSSDAHSLPPPPLDAAVLLARGIDIAHVWGEFDALVQDASMARQQPAWLPDARDQRDQIRAWAGFSSTLAGLRDGLEDSERRWGELQAMSKDRRESKTGYDAQMTLAELVHHVTDGMNDLERHDVHLGELGDAWRPLHEDNPMAGQFRQLDLTVPDPNVLLREEQLLSALAQVHLQQARSFLRTGDALRALELLDKARALARDDRETLVQVYTSMVQACEATGDWSRAQICRDHLVRLTPPAPDAGTPTTPVRVREHSPLRWTILATGAAVVVLGLLLVIPAELWIKPAPVAPAAANVAPAAPIVAPPPPATMPAFTATVLPPPPATMPSTQPVAALAPSLPAIPTIGREQLLKDNVALLSVVFSYDGAIGSSPAHMDLPLASGTAFAIDRAGLMVTNKHVVDFVDNASIPVTLRSMGLPDMKLEGSSFVACFGPTAGDRYVAKLLHKSERFDLALLRVSRTFAHPLQLATHALQQGDDVLVCGYPGLVTKTLNAADGMPQRFIDLVRQWRTTQHLDAFAGYSPESYNSTLTKGIVSSPHRVLQNVAYMQIDATMSAGNSGGPVLNLDNEVVGIATWGIRAEDEPVTYNFAVLMDQLREDIAPYRQP